MEAQKNNNSIGGVEAAQELKATAESGSVISGINKNQFPTQPMIPPHYFPPQQYPPNQFPGYPMYPMMPYPQMYGYHQFPHHMNMMPPQSYAMPPTFAKPPKAPPATSATDAPNKVAESKDWTRSAPADRTSDETISLSVKPTVSTESSSGEDTGSGANPSDTQSSAAMKTKTEMLSNSQISLQGCTSVESESETALLEQTFKLPQGDNVEANNGNALKKNTTVSDQEDLLPPSSQMKQEDRPSSSPPKMEEVIEEPWMKTEAHPQDDSTTSSNKAAVHEKEKKSEVLLHEIDSIAIQCADKRRNEQEGIESLLLLSRVADVRSSEDESNKVSIHKQQSGQDKPSKKRKLQLPMRADRKEEPVPKRVPPPPQRTPAFFYFLLHHKESIEQAIFSDEDTCCGLERSQKVATEGARWWLQSTEDEKQMWADVSTQKYLDLLS
jgi:hypothetical protein